MGYRVRVRIFRSVAPVCTLRIRGCRRRRRRLVTREAGKRQGSEVARPLFAVPSPISRPRHTRTPQVWNDNAGDKKPSPDVLIGKGSFSVKHLALGAPVSVGGNGGGGGGDVGDAGEDKQKKEGAEEEGRNKAVITVSLLPDDERRRKKGKTAGVVTLVLSYTPPRSEGRVQ